MVHVLVVDDDPQVRELLRTWLESDGHEVVAAPDGRKALETCRQYQFDLVITDVLMPDMDGIEFLRLIRDEKHQCRLMAISGGNAFGLDFLDEMKMFGATQTLAKPFSGDQLNRAGREVMEV